MTPLLELNGVTKAYGGLRPLRIRELVIGEADSVALVGFDRPSAEVLVNLITGATLPDAGDVMVFGRSTRDITDSTDWLTVVDRFGIVSDRAVLLDSLTVLQNLAMPFTLDIDPLADDARDRAIGLAREVGFSEGGAEVPVSSLDLAARLRVRVARAVALDPKVLLVEHASDGLGERDAVTAGAELRAIAKARRASLVAITADEAFGRAVAARVLRWEPATGKLAERRSWLRGRLG